MKSLKSLHVTPNPVIFENIDVGESRTIDLFVRNASKKPLIIRFSIPISSPFKLTQTKSTVTAPGLGVHCSLQFTCKKLEIIKSMLKVQCENFIEEVPILVYPPAASISVQPPSIDLGTIALRSSAKSKITLKNTGPKQSEFKVDPDTDAMKVKPRSGTIKPGEEIELSLFMKALIEGKFRFNVHVTLADSNSILNVPVAVNVVEAAFSLMYEGKEITELNFGRIFFGQKRVVYVDLINRGPEKRSFVVNPDDQKSSQKKLKNHMQNRATKSNLPYNLESIFTVQPNDGMLNPDDKTTLSVVFQPPQSDDMAEDLEYAFNHTTTIAVQETGQIIDFQLSGTGVLPKFKLSSMDFNFDFKKVNTKSVQTLTIYNESQYLPISYEIGQIAQFRFKPSTGTIKPKESKDVTIIFFPKNIGEFEEHAYISFCNGLTRQHINLVAHSLQTSDEPKPFQRTEIYKTDPDAHFNALHPDTRFGYSMKEILHNKTMRQTFDKYLTDQAEKRTKVVRKTAIRDRAIKDITTYLNRTGITPNEEEFKQMVKEEVLKQTKPYDSTSQSQCESLKPPDVKMAPMNDNLVVPFPEKLGLISRFPKKKNPNGNQQRVFMDDRILIKSKFKPFPTTPPEINECSRTLSTSQQALVYTSHQGINFGVVSVFSSESRSFMVRNNLEQCIFVEFYFDDIPELKQSTPKSQIVPPMQTAGFDLIFSANEQSNYSSTVRYTINKVHEYFLTIIAQVIPIELNVERKVIDFRIPYEHTEPIIKEYLQITNTSNSFAEFSWSGFENSNLIIGGNAGPRTARDAPSETDIFSVSLLKGKIEPKSVHVAEIIFKPGINTHYEQNISLEVAGGFPTPILLVGDIGKPRVTLSKRIVNFGLMPINVEKSVKLRLKNVGQDDGIFTVSQANCSSHVTIFPTQDRINANDVQFITFTAKFDKPGKYDYNEVISVCGCKPINISISGQAILPEVVIEHEDLNFGQLFMGSSESRKVTIKNVGRIPAVLYLDLSKYKGFHLEFSSELSNVSPTANVNSILQVSEIPIEYIPQPKKPRFKVQQSVSSSKIIMDAQPTSNNSDIIDKTSTGINNNISTKSKGNLSLNPSTASNISKIEDQYLCYKMNIIEQSELEFVFVFQPTDIVDYIFNLPFILTNTTEPMTKINPQVKAKSIKPPILPCPSLLHFGLAPVFTKNNPNNRPVVKELKLTNNYHQDIEYRLGYSDSSVFSVDKPEGVIGYSSTVCIFISFRPDKAQPFNCFLPLYVKADLSKTLQEEEEDEDINKYLQINENGETLIGKIQLTGIGTSRHFKTSTNYLCLPIVPLNIKIERSLDIINSAFIDTTITVHTTLNEKFFPLKIELENGNKLKHTEASKKIIVSFESSKPLSFSTIIALTSDTGDSYSFTVSATADNSVFTLYPFLNFHTYTLKSSHNKPITLVNEDTGKNTEFLAHFLSTSDYLSLENDSKMVPQMVYDFVKRVINSTMLSAPIAKFPEDLANSEGQLLFDIISNLCGQKKPFIKKTENTLEFLDSILKFLMSCGACVSEIKPEFLLPKEQFLHLMRSKIINRLLGIDYYGAPDQSIFDQKMLSEFTATQNFMSALLPQINALEKLYYTISAEAYTFLIMQIVKVFILPKCKIEKFNSIPGMIDLMKELKENLSEKEFAEINISQKNLGASNVYTLIESSLLKWLSVHYAHLNHGNPIIITDFLQLNNENIIRSVIQSHFPNETISDSISDFLQKLQMNFFPTEVEMKYGNHLIECYVCLQLFNSLPHYAPSSIIEFKTELNKPILQRISISNPSKNEIFYRAILEGSANFKCLQNYVILPPNHSLEFPVEYNANTHVVEKCKLTLLPGKPRAAKQSKNIEQIPSYSTGKGVDLTNIPDGAPASVLDPLPLSISSQTGRASTSLSSRRLSINSISSRMNNKNSSHDDPPDSAMDSVRKPNSVAPSFAAPIVVELVSDVQVKAPLKSYKIEGKIYEPTSLQLDVESPIRTQTKFQIISKCFRILDENDRPINEKINPSQQLAEFLADPFLESRDQEAITQLDIVIRDHRTFVFSLSEIDLPMTNPRPPPKDDETKSSSSSDSFLEKNIQYDPPLIAEFNPISLGTYRCLILFLNETQGEFVYEIIAKATLPNPTNLNSHSLKAEANLSTTVTIPIEVMNSNLPRALAYSYERISAYENGVDERRFKELSSYRTREMQNIFMHNFISNTFKAYVSAPQFFQVPNEIYSAKSSSSEGKRENCNSIPVTFSPSQPGDYPSKIILISPYDVRVYLITATGLMATRKLEVVFDAVAGREIIQELPISNPSSDTWNFRTNITGNNGFSASQRFSVEPKTVFDFPLRFYSKSIGGYRSDLTVTNVTKDANVIYKLIARVADPLAERKIVINCRAREQYVEKIDLPPLINNGSVNVESTVPILTCPDQVQFFNKVPKVPFEFSIYALRSGITAGKITFTDPQTKLFCWYIIECNIDSPLPEETIHVHTNARKTTTIDIPLNNPKPIDVTFEVSFTDPDFFGDKTLTIKANSKAIYHLVFSPLIQEKRLSSISFYNDTEGEFIYLVNLEVGPPEASILSPFECDIGKNASTTISLNNPLSTQVSFTLENTNPSNFKVDCDHVFQLDPYENRPIEIIFTPINVGIKQTADISFNSPEVGDYFFKAAGIGRTPQPLSPTIVEAAINGTGSATINFTNPFHQPSKFTLSLNTETPQFFKLLSRKRGFTLNKYGDSMSIPIAFKPVQTGQYKANLIISQNDIQWFFPIIGTAKLTETYEVPCILGESGATITDILRFPIVGEREEYKANEYKLTVSFPKGYEFLSKYLKITPIEIVQEQFPTIVTQMRFIPRRPLKIGINIDIENPSSLKWHFDYNVDIINSPPIETIELECVLRKEIHHQITIREVFKERTAYHAYFAPGSATEFSVTSPKGFIEQSLRDEIQLPFDVVFKPRMYGKVLNGLLVVDTLEAQYLYEFIGRIPDYVPPLIKWSGRVDNKTPDSVLHWKEICTTRKRNIIKDNIESVKIARPKTTMVLRRQKWK